MQKPLDQIADTGDRLETLKAIRQTLASALMIAEPHMAPQISGQLRSTMAEIAELERVKPATSKLDELRERRERKSPTAVSAEAAQPPVRKTRKRSGA